MVMINAYFYNHNGKRQIEIHNIDPEDSAFFIRNNIVVSIEELGGIVAYARPIDADEEQEVIVIAYNMEPCEQVMAQLRRECEKAFSLQ